MASTSDNKKKSHQLDPSEVELSRFSLRNLFKLNDKSTQQLVNQSNHQSSKLSTPNATSLSRFSMSSISLDESNNNIIMNTNTKHQQHKHHPGSINSTNQKQLSVLDLTSRVERLSNTNLDQLMNPLMAYHPVVATQAIAAQTTADGNTSSLLTIKRQSFKLSKKVNKQRPSLILDDCSSNEHLDSDSINDPNNDLNYNEDVEKAFNEFYTTNKIEGNIAYFWKK